MAAARPLPQFDPSDLADGQLITKLRQLTRTVELAYGADTTAETGGAWHVGHGQPAAGLGAYNDLYIDVTDAETHIVWLKAEKGWAKLGALASTEGGEANTASNAGEGVGLALDKKGLDLPFKSLTAGSGISVRDAGDHVVIAFTDKVDGGYFTTRKDALHLQFARGQKRNLPSVGDQGEPFVALDTWELFFGANTGMKPLRVAPENVIGLLAKGKIAAKYLPETSRPSVHSVNNETSMRVLDAERGDIAVVDDADVGGRGSFAFNGQRWVSLNRPIGGLASYRAAQDIPQFAVVALTASQRLSKGVTTYTAQATVATNDLFDQAVGIAPQAGLAGQPISVQSRGDLSSDAWDWTPGATIYGDAQGVLTEQQPTTGYLVIGFAVTPTKIRMLRREELRNAGEGAALVAARDGSVTDIRTLVGDPTINVVVNGDQVEFTLPTLDGAVATLLIDRAAAADAIADRELRITLDTREILVGVDDGTGNTTAEPARVDRDNVIDLGCYRLPAGETLGGHRVVVARDGQWFYADPADLDDAAATLAITTGAAAAGETAIARFSGLMAEPSWAWQPGEPVFFGASGVLSQTPPGSGFICVVGTPVSATQIAVNIEPPILLQE
ncbi:hypothetical protein [Salinisphaera hydrothermalis]|uniref:Uncharacterized protein n=1 Tax=Salinisphaera hydrothermalis (strain C41B8) TaxID=1304275 RepID=A0A084INM0_SALHC|nr:hypothetical protein [Salinisphaera hydrothermalis]KEZ78304.1 hypothetical protein C41B8_05363 [Salinisphaera hydrothermalis C41B8]